MTATVNISCCIVFALHPKFEAFLRNIRLKMAMTVLLTERVENGTPILHQPRIMQQKSQNMINMLDKSFSLCLICSAVKLICHRRIYCLGKVFTTSVKCIESYAEQ